MREVLVNNERVKLGANALNALATSAVAGGVLAQVVGVVLGTVQQSGGALAVMIAFWVLVGLYLHLAAQWVLGALRE